MTGFPDGVVPSWPAGVWVGSIEGILMLLWLAIILAVAWIAGFGVFHVASTAIHILVVLAVISLLVHLIRGKKGA